MRLASRTVQSEIRIYARLSVKGPRAADPC